MEHSLSELETHTLLLPSGEKISLTGLCVDSENGKILGLCAGKNFFDTDNIVTQGSLWKYQGKDKGTFQGHDWRRFRIQNHRGDARGVVSEMWFDAETFFLTKIECTRTFLKLFPQKRIYRLSDIFEVLPSKKRIIVHEENRAFGGYRLPVQNLKHVPSVGSAQCQKKAS